MPNFEDTIDNYEGNAYKWSQIRFIKGHTFGKGGVCYPLSVKWIIDQKLGANFNRDMRTTDAIEEVFGLRLEQTKKPTTFAKEHLALYGINWVADKDSAGEVSIGAMLDYITKAPGYYVLGLSSMGLGQTGASGHAFGFNMYKMRWFDPNFGMATFPRSLEGKSNLKRAFSFWFRFVYMDMRGSATIARYS